MLNCSPRSMKTKQRCSWCPPDDPLYTAYHDEEWGMPEHDGSKLFEMINLEGAQAGLSWRTVLVKRERYREVFEGFDHKKLVRWTDKKVEKALLDPGIIRNRLKVNGVVRNARRWKSISQATSTPFPSSSGPSSAESRSKTKSARWPTSAPPPRKATP